MIEFENINQPILRLTDEQLLDYMRCPNYFYIKYLSRIPVQNEITLGSCVKQVINYYFAKLMDGKIPTMNKAKSIWDKICDAHTQLINNKKVLEGLGLINLFDKYCYNNKLIIADFNSPYELSLPNNIIITGSFGAIRLNNGKLELFFVETSQTKPTQQLLDMSIRLTLQCYAMHKLSPEYELNCIRVLHIKSGTEFLTYRTKKDFDRLEKNVVNIAKAIREKIYYPREDYTCTQCKGKNYCGYV